MTCRGEIAQVALQESWKEAAWEAAPGTLGMQAATA
jgi:hypothetical protein